MNEFDAYSQSGSQMRLSGENSVCGEEQDWKVLIDVVLNVCSMDICLMSAVILEYPGPYDLI